MKELNDNELEEINGGYNETTGYASGYVIRCPKCGASDFGAFKQNSVDALGQEFYACKCGCSFLLDGGGYGTILYGGTGQFNADPVRLL